MKKFIDLYEAVFTAQSKQEKINNRLNYIINKNMLIKRDNGLYTYRGGLDFSGLNLKSLLELPYQFDVIHGGFYCNNNQLKTLEGCPQKIYGTFTCAKNNLTSLEGGPKEVKYSYYCFKNKLVTLKGSPKQIKMDFECSYNPLVSFAGCPEIVGHDFTCINYTHFSEEDIKKHCKVMGKIYVK